MEPVIALPRLLLPLLVVTLAACSQAVPAPVESARAAMAAPAPGKTPKHPRRGRLDLQDAVVKRKLQSAILEARSQPKAF